MEAARRQHDEHLSVGSYHLFRLPEETEQDLHRLVQAPEGNEIASRTPMNKDGALAALEQLAGATKLAREGPIAVGTIRDLATDEVLQTIAGVYWSAFSNQFKSYPYLAP
jgi:hypothetical protein